jgi:DNA-binding response OmpR family regulator
MQIVLAEDNPADVELVRQALHQQKIVCDLIVIQDGEQAIKFLTRLDADRNIPCPALLLLDLHLPRRGGDEILKSLRATERCGQTPVVILSSSDSPKDRANAEKNAALHYFRKPSTLNEFMELGVIIKEVIDRAKPC